MKTGCTLIDSEAIGSGYLDLISSLYCARAYEFVLVQVLIANKSFPEDGRAGNETS